MTILLSTLICIRRTNRKNLYLYLLENGLSINYHYYFGMEAHLSHRFNRI